MPKAEFLLGVRGELGVERSEFRAMLSSLAEIFHWRKISSLYVGEHELRSQKRSLQCVSFCVLGNLKPGVQVDVARHLADFKLKVQDASVRPHFKEVLILDWGGQVRIDPTLVLPHPEWYKRKYWLLPSAEIEGERVHPILRRSLREILAEVADGEAGAVKFLDRSQGLLDFVPTQT